MADWNGGNGPVGIAVEAPGARLGQAATIHEAENGFIVSVGCKNFVFKSFAEVSEALDFYYKDPEAARKKYCKEAK